MRPVLGIISMILATIIGILPIPLGWLFFLIGGILLAPNIPILRKMIIIMERKDKSKSKRVRRVKDWIHRVFPHRKKTKRSNKNDLLPK